MEAQIEVNPVRLGARVESRVLAVLRSGQLAQGPAVAEFEELVAKVSGAEHAIAVTNGTVALLAALRAAGVGPGDAVVTTPFTFVATQNAIVALGARPIFADVDAKTLTLCPESVDEVMTPRVRAIVPVHLFGQTADMSALSSLARRHSVELVQDAAQAIGAEHQGCGIGTFGLASYSFYATKNVTTGEGGAVTTDDPLVAEQLRRFRNQGLPTATLPGGFGLNCRLTDVHAAIGIPQLEEIDWSTSRRIQNAAVLQDGLAGLDDVAVPRVAAGDRHVFHHFTIRIGPGARTDRDAVRAALERAGIQSGIYYRALASEATEVSGRADASVQCPRAAQASREVLSLPVHQHLSGSDLTRIIGAVRGALE